MKLLATLLILIVIPSLPAAAAHTYCTAQEWDVFSCSTGKKIVSVCGSKDLSANSGALQYRFGTGEIPELVLPEHAEEFHHEVKAGQLAFSGGGAAYLRFSKGPFLYVVYEGSGRGWGSRAGVAVERNHKLVANLPCVGEPKSELGPDFFDKAGLAVDSENDADEIWGTLSTW